MAPIALDPLQPDQQDIDVAGSALEQVRQYLERHPAGPETVRLRVEDSEAGQGTSDLVVPHGAVRLFARILAHMAAGEAVSVVPMHAELTTQQAAAMLNVSRPFLVGLLEAGEIDYRKVGSHRRVTASSLLDYRRQDDQRRRVKADELVTLTQEMGLD